MPSSVRTYMCDLLVITFYMVNDCLGNSTLLPESQNVVNLHICRKYQEAMLCNDLDGISIWYGTCIFNHFVRAQILMRTRIGNKEITYIWRDKESKKTLQFLGTYMYYRTYIWYDQNPRQTKLENKHSLSSKIKGDHINPVRWAPKRMCNESLLV